ncbi:MAG: hypothetical protein ACOYNC_14910 [Bacteroidales bacterium]
MSIMKNSNLVLSVCRIFVTPIDEVAAIISVNQFCRSVTLKNGKSWQELYFTPGTAEFGEKPKENDAGDLIEQSLKFIFPGEDSSNLFSFDALQGRPVLVKIEVSSGVIKLMGDLENGAKLSVGFQISQKASGSQMELSSLATGRACYLLS